MGLQSRVLGQERQNIKLGKARVLFWEHFSLPQDLSPWQGPRKSVLALCWGSSWQLDENDPKLPPLGWQDCPPLAQEACLYQGQCRAEGLPPAVGWASLQGFLAPELPQQGLRPLWQPIRAASSASSWLPSPSAQGKERSPQTICTQSSIPGCVSWGTCL